MNPMVGIGLIFLQLQSKYARFYWEIKPTLHNSNLLNLTRLVSVLVSISSSHAHRAEKIRATIAKFELSM